MGNLKCSQFQLMTSDVDFKDQIKEPVQSDLVFVFGSHTRLLDPSLLDQLNNSFPDSVYVGCTTAGEITANGVEDETLTLTSLNFKNTTIQTALARVDNMDQSYEAGASLAKSLMQDDLAYMLILSDGLAVNGSSLVKGVRSALPEHVPFSGGLAGDADRFQKTITLNNDGLQEKSVVGVGFYGDSLQIRRGSVGGWAPFGPLRTITRSKSNVVYEIDHNKALDIYAAYLGEEAKSLPASGLLFPLALSPGESSTGLIRTLLAIDEKQSSLTFAGDVPEGVKVQLMHANYDQLIQGAEMAAKQCVRQGEEQDEFALLISCVGRKLLMGNNIDLEVDAVSEMLGRKVTCAGFYSYGEIGPYAGNGGCELHNQTMTLTYLSEK